MSKGKIIVAGIGPGSEENITPAVLNAICSSQVLIGYKYYFRFVENLIAADTICIDTGMRKERERAEEAFKYAEQGKSVCVFSSGDSSIYGMAALVFEMKKDKNSDVEVDVLPGISAFQKASALLGCPVSHDFCVISLSDLMTSWEKIEKRIYAAAIADFVTAVYNPKSRERYWQLYRLKEIFLQHRSADTPVGYVRQADREEQQVTVTTLAEFNPEEVDMFTIVIVGNSESYIYDSRIVTPRGYYNRREERESGIGQDIMIRSFKTIEGELKDKNIPLDRKWALLHAIHTTADFDMENILHVDTDAVKTLHQKLVSKEVSTIITDVTMVASGIRKGALERLGVDVKCYLHDERVTEMATTLGITRTQAGIRLAVEEHPDALYAFGNAPTALMELCELMRKGKATPAGVVAAPVGFVNVKESKHMVKPFTATPKLIVEGRKGGSNLAATLVNAILTFDDAEQLKPGRDV